MHGIEEQLAELRRRVARIDQKFATGGGASASRLPLPSAPRYVPFEDSPAPARLEDLVPGRVAGDGENGHFETERLYERHRRHGCVDIAALASLPQDLLDAISEGLISRSEPQRWAFLDTETTGLAGGSGTCAFLIGVGSIEPEGFRVRQYLMRDFCEEHSMLEALTSDLERFEVLVTYNGKTYDQPLLETRYRMNRMKPPFGRMEHLDLLHGSRRLWKIRLENCRLTALEREILGVERDEDIPGELIPPTYFEFVRTRHALPLVPVLLHNAIDILSLACLTAIVPFAFRNPAGATLDDGCPLPLRHGADFLGVARWLEQGGRHAEALPLLRRAVEMGLPDPRLFAALWDIASLEKKLGNETAAIAVWTDLAASPNAFRAQALEELAKYYEHRERNFAMALEFVSSARRIADSPDLDRREQRLRKRLLTPRNRRLRLQA